jgi:beta-glucosidase
MAWYPGQQGGTAISEIITGKVNPSGKLPISIEKKLGDNPTAGNYYENVDRIRSAKNNPYSRVEYREGIFMGYRGYEKNNVQPLFPFGYGLSYTSFEYSDISVNGAGREFTVTLKVKNTGKVAGAEVAQVYVTDDQCTVVRPVKELKGFEKVFLKPGEEKMLSLTLDQEAFRFYDPYKHDFVIEPGTFTISVGSSSADIRLDVSLNVE